MEYCHCGSLGSFIRSGNRLSESALRDIMACCLMGLTYLHAKKIIHRDIKPDNLFLSEQGVIKVGDFGISRVLQFTQDLAQTAVGTPLYVAPEVVKGVGYDSKADVWSMGCTFYEILTFSPPFSGMSLSDLMGKVRTASYPRLSSRYECVPWSRPHS